MPFAHLIGRRRPPGWDMTGKVIAAAFATVLVGAVAGQMYLVSTAGQPVQPEKRGPKTAPGSVRANIARASER